MLISLKEKKNRPTDVLNNLRPVTPLNVHYKIVTKAIAHRVAKVFPDLISPNEIRHAKDRYIGEFTKTKKTC